MPLRHRMFRVAAAVQLLVLTLYIDFRLLPGSPLRAGPAGQLMDPRGSGQARLGSGVGSRGVPRAVRPQTRLSSGHGFRIRTDKGRNQAAAGVGSVSQHGCRQQDGRGLGGRPRRVPCAGVSRGGLGSHPTSLPPACPWERRAGPAELYTFLAPVDADNPI